jgi:glycosyltransferase involved in cell wall biosynthesis
LTATRTKRILSIQPVAERGGSDRALVRLARSLAHEGWDCHIALPGPSPIAGEYEAAGATVHVVPMRRITTSGSTRYWLAYLVGWPVAVARLTVLARRIDAGVIHSNSLHTWYGWAVAAVVRRPHVWHAREIVVQSGAALRLERFLCRHFADTVVAVSNAVADQLDPGNVVVRYDQVDGAEFHPGRAGMFRSRIGVPDEAVLVGAVGRVDTWKGLEVLLDAVPEMQRQRPDLQVVVAGGVVAGKEAYGQGLADRAALLPGVHWIGPRDDVAELIADLDVLVLPSTAPEPFGLAVIEALASGVPVVATDAGGPREILGPTPGAGPAPTPDGAAPRGRLIPPGDPARLAAAVVALLPPGASSTAHRRQRPVLPTATPDGDVPAVFEQLLHSSRSRWHGGRGRTSHRRPFPT